jgi:hypothetical protein
MKRTWEDNAAQFAELTQGNGWPFAVLVACSVEPGAGQSERGSRSSRRLDRADQKVSANKFAEKACTSRERISRYYKTWQEQAAKGVVPDATTLTPNDVDSVEIPTTPWSKRDAKPGETAVYAAPAPAKAIKPTQVAEAIKADPFIAEEATKALDEIKRDERQVAKVKEVPKPKSSPEEVRERVEARMDLFGNKDAREVVGILHKNARPLELALEVCQTVEFDEMYQEHIMQYVNSMRHTLDLVEMLITGNTANVDWDAELAKLGETS